MSDLHHATLSDSLNAIPFKIGKHQPRAISNLAEGTSPPFVQDKHNLDYHAMNLCNSAFGQPFCNFPNEGAIFISYAVVQILFKVLCQSNPIKVRFNCILSLINLADFFAI
jgi:hypothetical protein